MYKFKWHSTFFILCTLLILSACGGDKRSTEPGSAEVPSSQTPATTTISPTPKTVSEPVQPPNNPDPLKLVLYLHNGALTDEEFNNFFAEPVKQKFPHITMELLRADGPRVEFLSQQLITKSQMDIVYTAGAGPEWGDLMKSGVPFDMANLVKSYRLDMNRFKPETNRWHENFAGQGFGGQGQIFGLPFSQNGSALFYNTDILERASIPYPTDHMAWDEIIDIAQRIAGRVDGVHPLYAGSFLQFSSQFEPSYTHPQTDVPVLGDEKWIKAAQYYRKINQLPNNSGTAPGMFFQQTVAMYAGVTIFSIGQFKNLHESGNMFNWDLASFPNFSETKGKALPIDVHSLLISSTSEHKEEAFKVIDYVTDEENQLKISRQGRITGLNSARVLSEFGKDLPFFEGKNTQAVFLNQASIADQGKFYNDILQIFGQLQTDLLQSSQDVNTVFRNFNEAAAQVINEKKSR